jgi:hypothetical protein
MIHYARLRGSPRQQRTLGVLCDGGEHSTRELIERAAVCAVNSIVCELRAQGIPIACRRQRLVWYYRLGLGQKGKGL